MAQDLTQHKPHAAAVHCVSSEGGGGMVGQPRREEGRCAEPHGAGGPVRGREALREEELQPREAARLTANVKAAGGAGDGAERPVGDRPMGPLERILREVSDAAWPLSVVARRR